MPRVLALLALLATLVAALLLAPSAATAYDLEPTSATPDVTIVISSSLSPVSSDAVDDGRERSIRGPSRRWRHRMQRSGEPGCRVGGQSPE